MINVQQTNRFSLKVVMFAVAIFTGQSTVLFADFSHPLHLQTDECQTCLATSHLANGLIQLPVTVTACANSAIAVQPLRTSYRSNAFVAYAVRAPPLS